MNTVIGLLFTSSGTQPQMASDADTKLLNNAVDSAHDISAVVDSEVTSVGDDQLLNDVIRSLPSTAVKDLLSKRVCSRCIFRLFGVRGAIYSCALSSETLLRYVIDESSSTEKTMVSNGSRKDEEPSCSPTSNEIEVEPQLCYICLGILQFNYTIDKKMLARHSSFKDLAVSIAELVKEEGHEMDSFSLEISIPPIVLENEQAIWLYMKQKYGCELWFQQKSLSEKIPVKDVLKFSLTTIIEALFDTKSGSSLFRIRLTYTHNKASNVVQKFVERKEGFKRRKTETNDAEVDCSNISTSEAGTSIKKSSNGVQNDKTSDCFKFSQEKVNQPCHLTLSCNRTSIYFGGRYLKYSRKVSQSRWIIDDERMGEASVEEIIGGNILPMCQGDNYKFHAAGREDIDVRMLGSGRPFLVEVQNARHIPTEVLVKETEAKINNLDSKLVGVKNLKVLGSEGWSLMHEGEAEKQKQYVALVWISRPLEDEDLQYIASLKDMKILQKTPIRVLHRRSHLDRERTIHWMKVEKIVGSSQYFLLHLCTQAGTYIKEFVHGDLGRTSPSIGSILGCRSEIIQLDVTNVIMDCFMAE